MVFAKTSKAASRLSDVLRRQEMMRKYLAVVRNRPKKDKGRLKHYLYKDRQKNQVYAGSSQNKKGKKAILDYELLKQFDGLSLLSVQLHTGRSHQIRVQLAEDGMPLYGDQKYGSHVNKPGQQIAFWSYLLKFTHPPKDEMVEVKCQAPNQYSWPT